ncbi:RHS repeat protein [Salmonella enterica subsp. salamae]|uniref:RHS repeat protein n=1 Tax=Salmonella enterica TaxID=28901 RepID=A0A5V4ZCL3_SALER|nr:RHS repeat protein [Salmonella enterica]ECH9561547.1 RHS repeat protein [Salmonella enterica subsp. salamae]ECI4610934.1 RHS repeat protein [Salmonella enterica subsp. diarizonae]EEE1787006.1 RHS repeat protein [Salmonella enterica subsp. diarizonae serovar 61:l,v:1,5,7]EBU1223259.1 RHS repeat protein [Salmonella enterica]
MSSLAGQVIKRESTDSGWLVTLFDAAARLVWFTDGRGTTQEQTYDELGRPVQTKEQQKGGEKRVSRITEYGDKGLEGDNLKGLPVRQYDDSGLQIIDSVALSGATLQISQQFLASGDIAPNWPADDTSRKRLLDSEIYVTSLQADASANTLNRTDAMGHQQSWRYDVSGKVTSQAIKLAGETKQTLLEHISWSAASQVLEEKTSNGVTTAYGYEPETQWLSTLAAQRADNTVLQSLVYGYDNTGNVTSITDNLVATRYYQNQVTDGQKEFSYDALYQLLEATGRENAGNKIIPYSSLPAALTPIPTDNSQYVNYTRTWIWDDSGNLQSLAHTGAGNYTRTMVTETTSNRSVQMNDGGAQDSDEVSQWFDNNGNLKQLQISASSSSNNMLWDGSNNLQTVVLLCRDATDMTQNDREIYQYSGSRRVRKQTRTLTNASQQLWSVDEVRYLPGLELRQSWQESVEDNNVISVNTSQELHAVTGQIGRAGIRILHWESGKPDGIDNNQLRWSLCDNIGSASLELDADGQQISREEYYPFGGTAVWAARSELEASYKVIRYSGKERDGTGLYYYGYRHYAPWLCRWTAADPGREIDGLNLYRMVRNNPLTLADAEGLAPTASGSAETPKLSAKQFKEVNGVYKKMATGKLWQRKPNGPAVSIPGSTYEVRAISARNIENLKKRLGKASQEQLDFFQRFKQLEFQMVHHTNAWITNPETLETTFLSRDELIKRKMVFDKTHTTKADVVQLANTGFAFFALSVKGIKLQKNSSRFGSNAHVTSIDKAKQKSPYMAEAHMILNDTLKFQERKVSDRLVTLLGGDDIARKDAIAFSKQVVAENAVDTLFHIDDLHMGLSLSILWSIKTAPISERSRKILLGVKGEAQFEQLITTLFRPQILVPVELTV